MRDVVYFLKDSPTNEELRYSLRALEKNFEYNRVFFFGGCPDGIKPDKHFHVKQMQPTKWERVNAMLEIAAKTRGLSQDFYLFNDDFFIMRPWEYETIYNKDLYRHIMAIEDQNRKISGYTARLREAAKLLDEKHYPINNYATHTPLLLNKQKVKETLKEFPNCPMFRSLYGNHHNIGGTDRADCKISSLELKPNKAAPLLSTSDKSFKYGLVGEYIRRQFPEPSKYEVQDAK